MGRGIADKEMSPVEFVNAQGNLQQLWIVHLQL